MSSKPQIPTIHLDWLAPAALAAEPYREVFDQALRAHGWPTIRFDEGLTARGWEGFAERASAYADRLRRGAELADLPIEPPGQDELIFHRQTARALGLTLPSSLLEQADEVFG